MSKMKYDYVTQEYTCVKVVRRDSGHWLFHNIFDICYDVDVLSSLGKSQPSALSSSHVQH